MVAKESSSSHDGIYWVVLLFSLAVVAAGIYLAVQYGSWVMLAAGCASTVAVSIAWPIMAQLRAFHAASAERAERALTSVNERFEQFSVMLNMISEQQLLSDRAKAVAFREKDSDALRRAIQDEMLAHNWDVATSLASEMEKTFGYRQEAETIRLQIEERRQEHVRKQVGEAAGVIDRHVRGEAWAEAMIEAQRVAKLYPGNPQAVHLPQEVENRREGQKKLLIDSWNDAVARHDVDGAIEILKRLDAYLTPTEAEAYQESARSIFKERQGILRTQFATAVQDHKWAEALRLADAITTEFPNTQMAKEVREMMDSLRARASGLEPASVS